MFDKPFSEALDGGKWQELVEGNDGKAGIKIVDQNMMQRKSDAVLNTLFIAM